SDVYKRQLPRRAAVAVLVPAVVIAMAGFGVEEFGNAWATLFLITERGLDPAAAVLGASTLLGAQFVGRLAGDRTLAALGRRGALTAGLGAVVVGLGLALAPLPGPVAVPAAFAGLALAGLGCAVVVPVAYALGDEAPGLRPQTGLAVTSWCMRLAGVGLSPAVGALAGAVGLAPALTVFLGLAAVGAVLAARLPAAP
ncbi:MFS transporter, partial [Micrococcus aloeverae]